MFIIGGYGSGRYSSKTAVEDCLCLDVNFLNREDYLEGGCQFVLTWSSSNSWNKWEAKISGVSYEEYIVLDYIVAQKNKVNYKVRLDKVAMNLGGFKKYLICPRCNKRVEKLYKSGASDYFLCRHCLDLVYRSSKESGDKSAKIRRELCKLYKKIGSKWKGVYSGMPPKPKNMHYKTYREIRSKIIDYEIELDKLLSMQLEKLKSEVY